MTERTQKMSKKGTAKKVSNFLLHNEKKYYLCTLVFNEKKKNE